MHLPLYMSAGMTSVAIARASKTANAFQPRFTSECCARVDSALRCLSDVLHYCDVGGGTHGVANILLTCDGTDGGQLR